MTGGSWKFGRERHADVQVGRRHRGRPPCQQPHASVRLVVCSANVSTLAPGDEDAANAQVSGDLLMGKVQIMEERFNEFGVRIAGIQEGRSRR